MCENKNNKWMCVAIVAAVVAALTTVAVFLLRARAKRKPCVPTTTALTVTWGTAAATIAAARMRTATPAPTNEIGFS